MLEDHKEVRVGDIGNYHGGLKVKVENGMPYWSITNWNSDNWEGIGLDLYHQLIKLKHEY